MQPLNVRPNINNIIFKVYVTDSYIYICALKITGIQKMQDSIMYTADIIDGAGTEHLWLGCFYNTYEEAYNAAKRKVSDITKSFQKLSKTYETIKH